MQKLTLVKAGGKILEDPEKLDTFLDGLVQLPGKKLLVHGGGVLADEQLKRQQMQPLMTNGRRITDANTLEVVTMVYGGKVSKELTAALVKRRVMAVGLTGVDGAMVTSVKRPVKDVDFGFAGDVVQVNDHLLLTLLQGDFLPIVGPLSVSTEGQILNTNADTIATHLTRALSRSYAVRLVYCFEKPGVLLNAEDDLSLVPELDQAQYDRLREDGKIHSGMIPKLDNAFHAAQSAAEVLICKYDALVTTSGTPKGTLIKNTL